MSYHISLTGEAKNPLNSEASLNMLIAIGFGSIDLIKNGNKIEIPNFVEGETRLKDLEKIAIKEPLVDWKLKINDPLWGATWQRQGTGKWIVVDTNKGFA